MSTFSKLAAIDVSKYVEKKGQFSYLSWPFAVHQLRTESPSATWEVKRFDGLPYLATPMGFFVEVSVTVEGITLSQIHPVLNARNQPIQAPTPFDINTSIQRCLVKAIALHGLGLGIYAGEDLPKEQAGSSPTSGAYDTLDDVRKAQAQSRFEVIIDADKAGDIDIAAEVFYEVEDNEMKLAIWELLKPFSALRRKIKELKK